MPVVDRQKERAIVERARARGWNADQIKAAVTAFREQNAPPAPAPKGEGFLASVAKPFTKAASSLQGVIEGVGELGAAGLSKLTGDEQGYQQHLGQAKAATTAERGYGIFGKARPVGVNQQTGENLGIGRGIGDILGTGAEIASYAAPIGGAEAAVGAAKAAPSLLGRLGAAAGQGAKFGALGGALAGGGSELAKPTSSLGSVAAHAGLGAGAGALVGGAIPAGGILATEAGQGARKLATAIGEKGGAALAGQVESIPSRAVNSILKPLEKEFRFGRDPGQSVVDEGIVANTRDELGTAITKRKKEIGAQIETALTAPEIASKKVDITPAIKLLEPLKQKAVASGDEALLTRLQAVQDGLEYTFVQKGGKLVKSGIRPLQLSPKEAQAVKREVGEAMRWTGQAFDNDVNQARAEIYRSIDKAIDDAVPGIKELNDRYAGMLSAEKSLERTMNVSQRNQMISFGDTGFGAAGLLVGGGPGALMGVALRRAYESTAFKTRIAQILTKLGDPKELLVSLLKGTEKEQERLLKSLPLIDRTKVKDFLQRIIRGSAVDQSSKD